MSATKKDRYFFSTVVHDGVDGKTVAGGAKLPLDDWSEEPLRKSIRLPARGFRQNAIHHLGAVYSCALVFTWVLSFRPFPSFPFGFQSANPAFYERLPHERGRSKATSHHR